MRCPNCERAELLESVENYLYRECGLDNVTLTGITVRKCPECGNIMPKIPKIEGLHDCIAHFLINREERLTPPEIVFLRKSLGWSGTDFARNMHCDRAQVSKWEHGKVEMSKPNELLLREMVARGKKIEDYHREGAARKDAGIVRAILLRMDQNRWKEAA